VLETIDDTPGVLARIRVFIHPRGRRKHETDHGDGDSAHER
jgi:hypothetical protein